MCADESGNEEGRLCVHRMRKAYGWESWRHLFSFFSRPHPTFPSHPIQPTFIPTMSTENAISGHDARILDMVFNPEGTMQPDRQEALSQKPVEIDPELLTKVQKLEQESILLAEKDDVEGAVAELTKAIELCPEYASAYNNRAQAYRILKNDDAALADLDLAIKYGTGQPNILKQAYTQRGVIKKLRGDKDSALIDFELGARYGNPVAKAVSVQDNPISQLCGAMVRDMLSAEINKSKQQ